MVIFGLAVLLVFLVLAAQYESWSLPLAIIMVVPMCILSAIIGVCLTHSDINIFTQIGFVVLVGLASKNAVLIVEFAKHKRENGMSRREATLEACRLRLRPILMTSFAFILGVVPLVLVDRGGIRNAASAGRGGVQRDAGRDVFRHFAHAGVLFRDRLGRLDARRCIRTWLIGSIACCSACSLSATCGNWAAGRGGRSELRLAAELTSPAKAEITEPRPAMRIPRRTN